MKKRSSKQDSLILLSCFLISRMIIKLLGVNFGYNALYEYWQYLDVTSLRTNLLQSLWYLHSQPPVFNMLLGIILKISGGYDLYVIESLLLLISFSNGLLILKILNRLTGDSKVPLIFSLVYILSPATMLYENELFYTTFISLLLLLAAYFITLLRNDPSRKNFIGVFVALALLCLTRSTYHLLWLMIIAVLMLIVYRSKPGFKKVLVTGLFCIAFVGGWYLKNYVIFDNFSASSWVGSNFSRIVFHDREIADSTTIASVHPFMPISYYKNFISDDYKKKYAGMDDRVLLMETKNGRYINMNNAGYLAVSKKYAEAGITDASKNPLSYFKNVTTAFIIFFTSASSYFKVTENDNKLRYYDLIYSLNPAHLFKDKHAKKKSLAIAAIPKFLLYLCTIFTLVRAAMISKKVSLLNSFIIITILFSLIVSSLLDYGENMRFRYETEPLFLLLLAQVIYSYKQKI